MKYQIVKTLVAIFLVVGLYVPRCCSQQKQIVVSKQTTWLTEPLDDEGYVDYFAAMNTRWGNVDSGDNAYVDLIKIQGPRTFFRDKEPQYKTYYELLGIQPIQGKSNWFVKFEGTSDDGFLLWEKPWTDDEFPKGAKWISDNETYIRRWIEASRKPVYYSPFCKEKKLEAIVSEEIAWPTKPFEQRHLFQAYIMNSLGEHDVEKFIVANMALRRFSNLVARRHFSTFSFLTSGAFSAISDNNHDYFIGIANFSDDQWRSYRQEWKETTLKFSIEKSLNNSERIQILQTFQYIARSQKAKIFFDKSLDDRIQARVDQGVNWNRILRKANQVLDKHLALVYSKDKPLSIAGLKTLGEEYERECERLRRRLVDDDYVDSNGWADDFSSLFVISNWLAGNINLMIAAIEFKTDEVLCETGLAIGHFRAVNGAVPTRLEELIPKYLPNIPIDPYSGKALIYKPRESGFTLYSVGRNQKDDGAIEPEEGSRALDKRMVIDFQQTSNK